MSVKAIPEGFSTVTPYVSVLGAVKFIEFLKQAFDAKETHVVKFPDGSLMSAEVHVGTSRVMIGEADSDDAQYRPLPARFYMYVDDVDAVYKRAVHAGAKPIATPADQFWGDRTSVVEDVARNQWWIATHKEDMSTEELVRRAMESN